MKRRWQAFVAWSDRPRNATRINCLVIVMVAADLVRTWIGGCR